jgi:hypothetical protein
MTQNATRTRKPRPKPVRSARLYPGSPALLVLTQGKEAADYFVEDLGRPGCFRLRKPLPETTTYDVDLGAGSCECLGHLRHGHRTVCKHRAALAALAAAGRLPAA